MDIIVDIDGTIADCNHRLHYIKGKSSKEKNFPAFEAGIPHDTPIEEMISIVSELQKQFTILILTGRGEQSRDVTEKWLADHGIVYEKLYMRPNKDYRPDFEMKKVLLEQIREDGFDPKVAFEDRAKNREMFINNGVFVIDVNQGNEREELIEKKFLKKD